VFWPGTKIETQVELPKSRSNSMIAADKLVITITRSNLLFFNDRPVEWANLELQLYDLVHRSKVLGEKRAGTQADEKGAPARSPLVVLRADQRISYSRIVQVISLARSLGLGVYLVTEPEKVGRGRGHRLVNENFD
jgi:biopolymer transport protein ExbD